MRTMDGETDDGQREAIEHGRGPCLVLAAPGSGKTYVVTQRFLRLVRDERIDPHGILALTYNRRAAAEMLQRVERELGPISGDAPLTTYHAWAFDVVRRHGWRLGWPETFRIPTPGERSLHLVEILRAIKPPSLFDPARPYDSVGDVKKLVEKAKQELVTPAAYRTHVERQLEADPSGDEKIYWERHHDLAIVYAALQERYHFLRLIDHDDAIAIAAGLLREFPDVQAAYESVRYVMVDEFQDTNSGQAEMVEGLVSGHENVMVVADDDQAIYRFRGASRLNIERFRSRFPNLRELALPVNRRSTPEIVRFSGAVIGQSKYREAKSITTHRPSGETVRIVWGHTYQDEAMAVVARVQELARNGAKLPDIAVLTQLRDDMEPITRALRAAAIPNHLDRGRDLFRTDEVKGIMALLEAIRDPEASQALLSCLRLPRWAISQAGRAVVLTAMNHTDDSPLTALRNGSIQGMSDEDREGGKCMASDLLDLQTMALHADVRDVFEDAMIRTSFPSLGDFPDHLDRARFASNVSRLYEIVDEYCRYRKTAHLDDALEYLRLVRETGEEREASIDQEVDAVRVSTIHGAKGLEWPHVIVCAAAQSKLPRPATSDRFELPLRLVEDVPELSDDHLEEQRRLFYVGLTRARDSLTVTWAKRYANSFKSVERTVFLEGMRAALYQGSQAEPATLAAPRRGGKPALTTNGQIRLSYSRIEDFDTCPRRFEYRSLWHMPPIFSPEGWYGDLLHRTLCRLGQLRLGGDQISRETVDSVWAMEWEAASDRGRVRDLREEGLRVIRAYIDSSLWTDAPLITVEHGFKEAIEHKWEWQLTGKIDRIDRDGDGIPTVVDYKSGRPGSEATARSSLQLKLYAKVAMGLYRVKAVHGSLHWLQTAESSTVTFTSNDVGKLDAKLFRIFEGVELCQQSGLYPAKPSTYRCRPCAFRLICSERASD